MTCAGANTPCVSAFASACLTENPTLGLVTSALNPANMTEPTGWTEQADTGYTTPTRGAEYVSRDSGHTGTTITWGNTGSASHGALIVELDARAGAEAVQPIVILAPSFRPAGVHESHYLACSAASPNCRAFRDASRSANTFSGKIHSSLGSISKGALAAGTAPGAVLSTSASAPESSSRCVTFPNGGCEPRIRGAEAARARPLQWRSTPCRQFQANRSSR